MLIKQLNDVCTYIIVYIVSMTFTVHYLHVSVYNVNKYLVWLKLT